MCHLCATVFADFLVFTQSSLTRAAKIKLGCEFSDQDNAHIRGTNLKMIIDKAELKVTNFLTVLFSKQARLKSK